MILLIWDSFGEESLKFYEIDEQREGKDARLAEQCHNHFINSANNDREMDDKLDKLCEVTKNFFIITPGKGGFGPYSAIYISGFIP